MSIVDRYQAYADAFEESFEDDSWSRLEEFFTEDAVYIDMTAFEIADVEIRFE